MLNGINKLVLTIKGSIKIVGLFNFIEKSKDKHEADDENRGSEKVQSSSVPAKVNLDSKIIPGEIRIRDFFPRKRSLYPHEKLIIICILVFIAIYVSVSLQISLSVKALINECNKAESEYSQFADRFEKEQLFLRVKYTAQTHIEKEDKPYAIDKLDISFPITFHLFTRAACRYYYTHTVTRKTPDETRLLCGSQDVPVTLTLVLSDWKWKVISLEEPP